MDLAIASRVPIGVGLLAGFGERSVVVLCRSLVLSWMLAFLADASLARWYLFRLRHQCWAELLKSSAVGSAHRPKAQSAYTPSITPLPSVSESYGSVPQMNSPRFTRPSESKSFSASAGSVGSKPTLASQSSGKRSSSASSNGAPVHVVPARSPTWTTGLNSAS